MSVNDKTSTKKATKPMTPDELQRVLQLDHERRYITNMLGIGTDPRMIKPYFIMVGFMIAFAALVTLLGVLL